MTRPLLRIKRLLLGAALVLAARPAGAADVALVTVLADFEDDSAAATIAEVGNVARTACSVYYPPIPARGQRCLALDVGVTGGEASATCDLRLRSPRRFARADRVAAYCWIKAGEFAVRFRVEDARGQVFETPPQSNRTPNRWVRLVAELAADQLKRVRGDEPLTWPVQVLGYRATTSKLGKQTLFLDDLEVEHRGEPREMLAGEFIFDEPTRIYEPGRTVGAVLKLENCSRQQGLQLSVELAWARPDESVLKTYRANLSLPPSGRDFRSRQTVDFSQRIEAPGLYRLTARAHAAGWIAPSIFQTSIAVTPSNRLLPRGRASFFGVRSDLLKEPAADRQLEIAVARDIGVQLLAIDTPWRLIQPARDRLDWSRLDAVVDALVAAQIAPLVVLTEPPEWVPSGPARLESLADALAQLNAHFGPKVTRYQIDLDALDVGTWTAAPDALQRIRQRLPAAAAVELVAPALAVDAPGGVDISADSLPQRVGVCWAFATEGDPVLAVRTMDEFRRRAGLLWQPSNYWFHTGPPLVGPSFFVDAEAVLNYYVRAALAGIGHAVWYDLRDNDNDPGNLNGMRGLVRRDFSPKASLQGFASAAGMLSGLACRGPVLGTPPEFESALFIGSDRQTVVLLPKPNRMYPAVLCPIQGAPGRLEARDFERRSHGLLGGVRPPLVPTLPRPLFLTLQLEHPQPEPQLAFVEPWIRAPAVAFCGGQQITHVEIQPASEVRRGSLWFRAAADAPFVVEPASRNFSARAGEKLSFAFQFKPRGDQCFERAQATLRIALDAETTDVPIQVQPLSAIASYPGGPERLVEPGHLLAELRASENQTASASVTVYAGHDLSGLHFLFDISDARLIPTEVTPDGGVRGDELAFGVAREGAEHHAELRVRLSPAGAELASLYGRLADGYENALCRRLSRGGADADRIYVRIPAAALGCDQLSPGLRLLLAARYQDDDADGLPPGQLRWGGGLDGRRSSELFRWVVLADEG